VEDGDMRLDDQEASSNVEVRRGRGGGGGFAVGQLSFGSIVLIAIFALLFRVNPLDLIQGGPATDAPVDQQAVDFSSKVLGSTETVWTKLFAEGKVPNGPAEYAKPTLVIYQGQVSTGCGGGSAAMGPFYCPLDQKLYLDTTFFQELQSRFQAPGDFAQAYVIAHEVGHHIQKLTGVSDNAMKAQQSMGKAEYNKFSVKMELQADCYAGVWGHFADVLSNQIEPGDIDEALKAATAIGDDTLQQQGQGRVVPDSFTHGTSDQRVRWFRMGFDNGDVAKCDTFKAATL
jgi:predicted metalloprotease